MAYNDTCKTHEGKFNGGFLGEKNTHDQWGVIC